MFSLPRNIHRYTDTDELSADLELLYTGCRAQNKAMASFCAADPRLLPVAFVPLVDPERATATAEEAIGAGCAAVMVPSTAAGERAPTHPDLEELWALLERSGVPFVLHVGGGGRLLDPAFHNNDMPVTDHLGGGENIRSKDYLAIHHSPEVFLGALILDGCSTVTRDFGADVSSRGRAGSCPGFASSTMPSGRSTGPKSHYGASRPSRRSTCAATSNSPPSQVSRWAG
jgi:Amidohydrolase